MRDQEEELSNYYNTRIKWSGDEPQLPPNRINGPPPPTYLQAAVLVELLGFDPSDYLIVRVVPTQPKRGEDEEEPEPSLEETLRESFHKGRISVTYEEVVEGHHFMVIEFRTKVFELRRVQVLKKFVENELIMCRDIDTYELVECACDCLMALKSAALTYPRQVFKVELNGLGVLLKTDVIRRALDSDEHRSPTQLVCTVIQNRNPPMMQMMHNDDSGINLAKLVESRVSQLCKLSVPNVGEKVEVEVTNLTPEGIVSVQFPDNLLLRNIRTMLSEWSLDTYIPGLFEGLKVKNFEEMRYDKNNPEMLFMTMFEGEYSRAKVHTAEVHQDGTVEVEYIDFGNVEKCQLTELIKLYAIRDVLPLLPPQALTVQLRGIRYFKDAEYFWQKAFGPVILRIDKSSGKVPKGSLYLKDDSGKAGECINDIMLHEGAAFARKPSKPKLEVEPAPTATEEKNKDAHSSTKEDVVKVKNKVKVERHEDSGLLPAHAGQEYKDLSTAEQQSFDENIVLPADQHGVKSLAIAHARITALKSENKVLELRVRTLESVVFRLCGALDKDNRVETLDTSTMRQLTEGHSQNEQGHSSHMQVYKSSSNPSDDGLI